VINNCKELESLAIPLCNVAEEALLLIRNTRCRVKCLDMFGSTFSEATLLFLFGNVFRNLRRLNISGVRNLSLPVFKYICLRSPTLQSLSLKGHIAKVTDEYLECISRNLDCLTVVDLGMCRAISNDGIKTLVEHNPTVFRELGFVSVPVLQDNVVVRIAEQCGERLEKLSLGGDRCITDTSLAALAKHCTKLRSLCLKGTAIENTKLLRQLIERNPDLKTLSLSGVKGVNDLILQSVAEFCKNIRELYLSGVAISKKSVAAFKATNPTCEVFGKRRRISEN
jgi:hypothetical protein